MSETLVTPESQEWKQARRAAFAQDVLAVFTRRPSDLLSFEEVRQTLRLRDKARYLGLQDVPLDHIVGSVGRYRDFTRAFFPRQDELQQRWQRIGRLLHAGHPFPPVELYKVGQVYFVYDGNHRVSVARQHNASTIQAYVWEYETRVPLEPDTDIKDLWTKAAHRVFLEHTNIDRLCPDQYIELSHPDGYEDLLHQIKAFQQALAPRPAMFVNGRRDPASSHAARESFSVAHQVYSFLGVPQRIKLIEPETMGHYYDNQLAISWFRRWLAQDR